MPLDHSAGWRDATGESLSAAVGRTPLTRRAAGPPPASDPHGPPFGPALALLKRLREILVGLTLWRLAVH